MTRYSVVYIKIGSNGEDVVVGPENMRLTADTRSTAEDEALASASRPPEAQGMKIFCENQFEPRKVWF